jgi:hypothetical protein
MACKGSGVQIPSAPPRFTRSNGISGNPKRPGQPQQNPNPASGKPATRRFGSEEPSSRSEARYPCRWATYPSPNLRGRLRPTRSTLRAEGGLPCSRRLGRSRVRHRRDPGRAARATLYAGSYLARRGPNPLSPERCVPPPRTSSSRAGAWAPCAPGLPRQAPGFGPPGAWCGCGATACAGAASPADRTRGRWPRRPRWRQANRRPGRMTQASWQRRGMPTAGR